MCRLQCTTVCVCLYDNISTITLVVLCALCINQIVSMAKHINVDFNKRFQLTKMLHVIRRYKQMCVCMCACVWMWMCKCGTSVSSFSFTNNLQSLQVEFSFIFIKEFHVSFISKIRYNFPTFGCVTGTGTPNAIALHCN